MRHGLREDQFRRYEPLIAEVVKMWPTPVAHKPDGISVKSCETLRARLRDAMLSLSKYQWTTSINMARFEEVFAGSKVIITDGNVYVRPVNETKIASDVVVPAQPISIFAHTDNEDIIRALLLLHQEHVLIFPTTIETPLNVLAYAGEYNVHVTSEKNTYTIH